MGGGEIEIKNKKKIPDTYRDLSWQLSKKKKNPARCFQLSPSTTPRMSEQHLPALGRSMINLSPPKTQEKRLFLQKKIKKNPQPC